MDSGSKNYTFFWFIENYSYCWHKTGEKVVSPRFVAEGLENTAWFLCFYPRGERDEYKGFVAPFLYRSPRDYGPEIASVRYALSVLAADGSPALSVEGIYAFKRGVGRQWPNFLNRDEVLFRKKADYLPQDILSVRCKIWKDGGTVCNAVPVFARTRIGIENISFMHAVESFSSLEPNKKNTTKVRSHPKKEYFASSSLYFTNHFCSEGEIIVEIEPFDCNHVLSKRKISLLDGSGNVIGCGVDDNRYDIARKDIQKLPLSLTRQLILNNKSEYLPDNKLYLLCECVFSTGVEFEEVEATQHRTPVVASKRTNHQDTSKSVYTAVKKSSVYDSLMEDIKTLYLNQYLTDVELKTNTKSFPIHKVLLCVWSPVFKAMLTSDVKEKHKNCIEVDDLRDDVVQKLLPFLYSDTIENLEWEMAIQLYYAADKYQIGKLKEVSSSFLMESLCPTNAGELLLLADTHSDTDLKKVVEDFILDHEEQVFCSDEWEVLMETNPLLVMKAMYLKYKKKKGNK